MFKRKRTIFNLLVSLIICASILLSNAGCSDGGYDSYETPEPVYVTPIPPITKHSEAVTKTPKTEASENETPTSIPTPTLTETSDEEENLFEELDAQNEEMYMYCGDYATDNYAFSDEYLSIAQKVVYNDIAYYLSGAGDVFLGSINIDNRVVYGIGYSNEETAYEATDGRILFGAGFVPYDIVGFETYIDLFGQEVMDLDANMKTKNDYGFVNEYCYDLSGHVLYEGEYITWDLIDGKASFEVFDYYEGVVDETRGDLYDVLSGECVFFASEGDDEFGEYVPIYGDSLGAGVDYNDVIAEMEKILQDQDLSGYEFDIDTYLYYADEALRAYLLEMGTAPIMGVPANEVLACMEKIEVSDEIVTDENGNIVYDFPETPEVKTPSTVTKFLVGACCAVAIIGGIAATIYIPGAGNSIGGAVIGASIEVFMQVVIEDTSVEDINYMKVGISAVSGAVCGASGTASKQIAASAVKKGASESAAKIVTVVADVAIDAVVGGVTEGAFAAVDGKDGDGILKATGQGVLYGLAIGAGLKVVGKMLKPVLKKVGGVVKKVFKSADEVLNVKKIENSVDDAVRYKSQFAVGDDIARRNVASCLPTPGEYKTCQNNVAYEIDELGNYLNKNGDILGKCEADGWVYGLDNKPIKQVALKDGVSVVADVRRAYAVGVEIGKDLSIFNKKISDKTGDYLTREIISETGETVIEKVARVEKDGFLFDVKTNSVIGKIDLESGKFDGKWNLELANIRNQATKKFWKKVVELLEKDRALIEQFPAIDRAQLDDIISTGKLPDNLQVHHIKSVSKTPSLAGELSNLELLTHDDHLAAHLGNYKISTGEPSTSYVNIVELFEEVMGIA